MSQYIDLWLWYNIHACHSNVLRYWEQKYFVFLAACTDMWYKLCVHMKRRFNHEKEIIFIVTELKSTEISTP